MSALFRRPLILLRECSICEDVVEVERFTDPRDTTICADCWRDHDEMVAEMEGEG